MSIVLNAYSIFQDNAHVSDKEHLVTTRFFSVYHYQVDPFYLNPLPSLVTFQLSSANQFVQLCTMYVKKR